VDPIRKKATPVPAVFILPTPKRFRTNLSC
jgi:hypothetical protein